MNKDIETLLNRAVKTSLGSEDEKFSIKDCWKNKYLNGKYEPFQMLEFELMVLSARQKLGIKE